MSQPQPEMDLNQLWAAIERDSERTREEVTAALTDVRKRLDTFVTREVWEAERRELERRLDRAEEELRDQAQAHRDLKERIEKEAREAAAEQRIFAKDFVYKGIIPTLSLVTAVGGVYIGTR